MNKLVVGILAHVDAGKTTLSESMLYLSGKIGKLGRVDNKDAYLDTYELERARGITIFSKQAIFEFGDSQITLLDTPGHVDFSAEMERTLQVLDYAILVISGADGVQGHTSTLWHLLDIYQIPVFLFINKMDQEGTDKLQLMKEMKSLLNDGCIDFGQAGSEAFYDQLAMCEEELMNTYLDYGKISSLQIKEAIRARKVFPCYFGSALKLSGVEDFMQGLLDHVLYPVYPESFGAKVFKITRDEQGSRLTYMKLTGGKLKVRDALSGGTWEEKVNQIRIYSGQKYEAVNEIEAGTVCAVTGLNQTRPGEGLGIEKSTGAPILEPVLTYQINLPEGCDPKLILPKLRLLEEEEPELHILWEEELQELQVQVMGEVQLEILQSLILSRFGIAVTFDSGKVVYKESILNMVEGVGHFEPLRHYAEVHLLLEPGEPGSGLEFMLDCSEDVLAKSWQRQILTHLQEKTHKGVLTGSAITDMRITVISGRAHIKHTVGGDFREATYRAVRQGLMEAESILLEPYYSFRLELPERLVGRAMTDIEKLSGSCEISQTDGETAVLVGSAPVITMRNYQKEVTAYTKGLGRLFCTFQGYAPCHNAAEVMAEIGYDAERDLANPSASVFCSHGAGYSVPWYDVKKHMHVEGYFTKEGMTAEEPAPIPPTHSGEKWISPEEVDQILHSISYANQSRKSQWKRAQPVRECYDRSPMHRGKQKEILEEYLLVDGYNIIFAWPELGELAQENMDGAKLKLLDELCDYQGIRKCKVIVVFDAYRVQGHGEEVLPYHNIHVVYTREAQTADQYIEQFAHENHGKYHITVATSDGLQQIIIRGAGCALLSARDLKEEMILARERMQQGYQRKVKGDRNYLLDGMSAEVRQQVEAIMKEEEGTD